MQLDPLLWKAYKLAKAAHQGRYRKNGQPVLAHCVATARMLSDLRLDIPTVAAGLLHDVLDDTPVTEAQMRSSVSQVGSNAVLRVIYAHRLWYPLKLSHQSASGMPGHGSQQGLHGCCMAAHSEIQVIQNLRVRRQDLDGMLRRPAMSYSAGPVLFQHGLHSIRTA